MHWHVLVFILAIALPASAQPFKADQRGKGVVTVPSQAAPIPPLPTMKPANWISDWIRRPRAPAVRPGLPVIRGVPLDPKYR